MKSAPWNTWTVRDIFCTQKGWTLEKKMNNLALDGSDLWLVHAVHTKTNGNILLSVGVCAVQWCCCGVVVNRRSSGACISPSLSCKTHDFIEAIWPIERATRWCLTRTIWCWWTGVFFCTFPDMNLLHRLSGNAKRCLDAKYSINTEYRSRVTQKW